MLPALSLTVDWNWPNARVCNKTSTDCEAPITGTLPDCQGITAAIVIIVVIRKPVSSVSEAFSTNIARRA